MRSLLSANFARLWKNRMFWLCMAAMFFGGILMVVGQYVDLQKFIESGGEVGRILNAAGFSFATFIGILGAAFTSLFFGTEYSDGTIRNKIVVGASRNAIYLSALITGIAAALMMCLAYIAGNWPFGALLLGGQGVGSAVALQNLVGCAVMVVAFCSIYTLLSMTNQNKAAVAVISLLVVFALLFLGAYIEARLSEPEFYSGYHMDAAGELVWESVPNDSYLRGTARQVYSFFRDFLPMGQALQYSMVAGAGRLWPLTGYSLAIAAVTTGVGLRLFRRKDLK